MLAAGSDLTIHLIKSVFAMDQTGLEMSSEMAWALGSAAKPWPHAG